MITKFIPKRIVGRRPKTIKLKPSKVKRQFDDQGRVEGIADQNIRDIFGSDPLEFGTVKHYTSQALRRESIGLKLAARKFNRSLPTELKAGRTVIARKIKSFNPNQKGAFRPTKITPKYGQPKVAISKPLKQAKSTSALKRWKKVSAESDKVFTDITHKASPFKHKLTEIKYVKSKKFKTGKFDQPYPNQYSKIEKGAYGQRQRIKEFASEQKNLTKQGKVNWGKFWKEEGPTQKGYIKYKRKAYKKAFEPKK